MSEKTSSSKNKITPDWLVQGILTKIGDTFDRLTGRGWKPSSSLATSELIERLKKLVDSEARVVGQHRKYVPHNIKLKMQWDKFSTDADVSLKKLETELLTALVDHINDKRYYTYAPISLEVKPDYFTSGVKLFAGFEDPNEDERAADIDVSLAGFRNEAPDLTPAEESSFADVVARFDLNGQPVEKTLHFETGKRLSVGRTKENDLAVDEASVSKMHASLMLNKEGQLVVADTGSTNGTFIDGERISYGKAVTFSSGQRLKIGTVEMAFEITMRANAPAAEPPTEPEKTDTYSLGEFEFTRKIGEPDRLPADTVASISIPEDANEPESADAPKPTEPVIALNRAENGQASK